MADSPRRVSERPVGIVIPNLAFRADHLRAIDRVIDYFGERNPAAWDGAKCHIGLGRPSPSRPR
jgi:hypothetical protein